MGQRGIPGLADLLAVAHVVRVPLRMPFRGVTDRVGVVLSGPVGAGEFAPFAEYGPAESSWWLDAAVEAAFAGWPAARRPHVGVNAIIPATSPERAAELAAAAAADGIGTIKIKVAEPGGSLASDEARVAAVRAVFGGAIRVDANGAWSPAEAAAALDRLDRAAGGLQYVEQPCATLAELAEVRRTVSVPVAADESVRRADDPVLAVRAGAADVVVVKVAPLGGVRRALRVVAQAAVPVVVSSALDTSVGLAAGVALAAALPELPLDCGLGSGRLLADDVCEPRVLPAAGRLPAAGAARTDPASLARAEARVTPAEREAWLARLAAAWHAGTAGRVDQLLADSAL